MQPKLLTLPSADAAFADRLRKVLDAESQEASFDLKVLAARLALSRTHLHRRTKEIFGLPPSELIIRFRLERAARMLRERAGTVGQIAYAVGFSDLSHFVKRFRAQYGQTPTTYVAAHPR